MGPVSWVVTSRCGFPKYSVRGLRCSVSFRSVVCPFSLGRRASLWQAPRSRIPVAGTCEAQTFEALEPAEYHLQYAGCQLIESTTTHADLKAPIKRKGGRPKGSKVSEETRRKMSAAKLGIKRSLETRAKISAGKKGAVRSAEASAKTALKLKGMQRSEETRAQMRAVRLGAKMPDGVKEKIRATMLARRKASEEELPPVRKKRVTAKPSTLSARAVPADRSSELEPAQLQAALTELKRLRDRLGNFVTRMEGSEKEASASERAQLENPQLYALYLQYVSLKALVRQM